MCWVGARQEDSARKIDGCVCGGGDGGDGGGCLGVFNQINPTGAKAPFPPRCGGHKSSRTHI
jgi:hypothetical protein